MSKQDVITTLTKMLNGNRDSLEIFENDTEVSQHIQDYIVALEYAIEQVEKGKM